MAQQSRSIRPRVHFAVCSFAEVAAGSAICATHLLWGGGATNFHKEDDYTAFEKILAEGLEDIPICGLHLLNDREDVLPPLLGAFREAYSAASSTILLLLARAWEATV